MLNMETISEEEEIEGSIYKIYKNMFFFISFYSNTHVLYLTYIIP